LSIVKRDGVAALEQALAGRIGLPRYKLWFEGRTKFAWKEGVLTVGVPNRHFEEWLQKTFHAALAGAATEVYGETSEVCYRVDGVLFQAARLEQAAAQMPPPCDANGEPSALA
jgi:chromosomal replication initiation ATPase DnaA